MAIAPLASVDKPVDVSGGIVPPISVVVPRVNHTALLVLLGDPKMPERFCMSRGKPSF